VFPGGRQTVATASFTGLAGGRSPRARPSLIVQGAPGQGPDVDKPAQNPVSMLVFGPGQHQNGGAVSGQNSWPRPDQTPGAFRQPRGPFPGPISASRDLLSGRGPQNGRTVGTLRARGPAARPSYRRKNGRRGSDYGNLPNIREGQSSLFWQGPKKRLPPRMPNNVNRFFRRRAPAPRALGPVCQGWGGWGPLLGREARPLEGRASGAARRPARFGLVFLLPKGRGNLA